MTTKQQADAAVAPLASLSRRKVLKAVLWGSAGAAVLAGGGVALLRRSPVDRLAAPDHLKHLSASEYHLFRRAIEVLLPTDGTPLTPVEQVPVIDNIDHLMGLVEPAIREELGVGLTLFDNAAVIVGLHGRRFVDLDDAAAIRYFDTWSEGNTLQRTLSSVVKKFVYVSYWRDPATWPPIRFDGAVSDRWGIPSLGNTPLPVEVEENLA
jgi:hypothetical protein